MMLLAHKGELDNDPLKYRSYVYPRQLDEVVRLEMHRIRERIELIRRNPMALHPPMPDLQIPDRLKMDPWPGIPS
ncbi:hypothetical protein [Bradyrhizobium sp. 145]|nr:hypothetical protein [Bradyrhizobium sp. 145]MCK1691014.1 hypothetical protein [Bradyrhizobium sp. 145]